MERVRISLYCFHSYCKLLIWYILVAVANIRHVWYSSAALLKYTMSQKNCSPKGKFIKISSSIMIFHTRHCHSVADWLSSKNLVWVEYQLQGFHGNQAPWYTTVLMWINKINLTEEDSILINNLYLLKGYGAKRLIKEHFSPLWIHLRVNLVCIKSFCQQDNE